jgi:hypothetical protein
VSQFCSQLHANCPDAEWEDVCAHFRLSLTRRVAVLAPLMRHSE